MVLLPVLLSLIGPAPYLSTLNTRRTSSITKISNLAADNDTFQPDDVMVKDQYFVNPHNSAYTILPSRSLQRHKLVWNPYSLEYDMLRVDSLKQATAEAYMQHDIAPPYLYYSMPQRQYHHCY